MLHDPAASWIWPQDAVAAGAAERASPDEIKGFFMRLRRGLDSARAPDP
jgi:hypothetical protein